MSLPMLNPKYIIFKDNMASGSKKLAHFSNRQLFFLKRGPSLKYILPLGIWIKGFQENIAAYT